MRPELAGYGDRADVLKLMRMDAGDWEGASLETLARFSSEDRGVPCDI